MSKFFYRFFGHIHFYHLYVQRAFGIRYKGVQQREYLDQSEREQALES